MVLAVLFFPDVKIRIIQCKAPVEPCSRRLDGANPHIREYRYAYGTVEPNTWDSFFLILPYHNTVCMNLFLKELSCKYRDDIILVVCDGAAWHKSNYWKYRPI